MSISNTHIPRRPTAANYAVLGAVFGGTVGALYYVLVRPRALVPPSELVVPMAALLGLTAAVMLLMGVTRNLLVALGKVSMRYFHHYADDVPAEAAERPARAFNNLMQLPPVFYVLCLLAMQQGPVDTALVQLAWMYVGLRAAHAVQLIGWNFVPYRFALFAASNFVLITFGVRVLHGSWPAH